MKASSTDNLLFIMAKAPLPGLVKTRLQSRLSPGTAADLYRCFLKDRLLEMKDLPGADVMVAYSPRHPVKTSPL